MSTVQNPDYCNVKLPSLQSSLSPREKNTINESTKNAGTKNVRQDSKCKNAGMKNAGQKSNGGKQKQTRNVGQCPT